MLAKCKDGVRILNVARGPLVVDADLQAALDSGKVAGAALDVFRSEPVTEHPLFAYPNVIVTPHLGASTAEATDRAGFQAAEQVVAALTGGVVTSAVNVPAISAEDVEVLGPYVPLCHSLGAIAIALAVASGQPIDGLHTDFYGRLAERDTRLLAIAVLRGLLAGHVEEDVNAVNAPSLAEERGIHVVESKHTVARDYTDFVRVEVRGGQQSVRVAGTLIGRRHRPHLIEAWGQRFDVQLESSHHPVSLSGPTGHAGPGRDHLRPSWREHRLGRGRAPARRGSQRRRSPGGDGHHHHDARSARRGRRDRLQPGVRRRSDGGALGHGRVGRGTQKRWLILTLAIMATIGLVCCAQAMAGVGTALEEGAGAVATRAASTRVLVTQTTQNLSERIRQLPRPALLGGRRDRARASR